MKKIVIISLTIFLSSCTIQMQPLLNNYYPGPQTKQLNLSYDEAWDKVIDYVSQKGMSVKIIDKASGLLVTEPYNFAANTTTEKDSGFLVDENAFIVCNKIKGSLDGYGGATTVLAAFNIRLKKVEDKSELTVNIGEVNSTLLVNNYNVKYGCQSTGKFEKMMLDELTK